MILAGDVGGTKTVLALFEDGVGTLEKVVEATYRSPDHGSLDDLVHQFCAMHGRGGLHAACFGVPGPVIDGACRTTNLPWVIDESVLRTALKVPQVRLLNDLQAAAYGMLFLPEEDFFILNAGRTLDRRRNMAVIAAGTGLGEAMLVWDGEKHIPVASEGGHASFSPRDDQEVELLGFLMQRLGGKGAHVSWERAVAGPALHSLYGFLKSRGGRESPSVQERLVREDPGSVIGLEAVNGTDALCEETVQFFCRLYGSEAGNLALKCVATGGVFIGGGIAPKILPVLQKSGFMEAFVDKGRYRSLLEGMPVLVAKNDRAPLIGAARYAARL